VKASYIVIEVVTLSKAAVQKSLVFLDSGPFQKLRVPSLSRAFHSLDPDEEKGLE